MDVRVHKTSLTPLYFLNWSSYTKPGKRGVMYLCASVEFYFILLHSMVCMFHCIQMLFLYWYDRGLSQTLRNSMFLWWKLRFLTKWLVFHAKIWNLVKFHTSRATNQLSRLKAIFPIWVSGNIDDIVTIDIYKDMTEFCL